MTPCESLWAAASEENIRRWRAVYPAVNVEQQLFRMQEWLAADHRRAKKNYVKFIVNWLSKNQRDAELVEQRELVRHEIMRQVARRA